MSKSKPSTNSASKVVAKPVPTAWKDRLNQQDWEELKNTFEVFDEDHSGTIDVAEINKVLEELGLDRRNPLVMGIINKLKEKNKPLKLDQFIDIVGSSIGQTRTRDGLQKLFALFDTNQDGSVDFDELKRVLKSVGDNMNDDDILQMMHSTFINKKTSSNEQFTFEEFYQIVVTWANK